MKFILLLANDGELMIKVIEDSRETLYRGAGRRGTQGILDATDRIYLGQAMEDDSTPQAHNTYQINFVACQAIQNFQQLTQFKLSIYEQLKQNAATVTWKDISNIHFENAIKAAFTDSKEFKASVLPVAAPAGETFGVPVISVDQTAVTQSVASQPPALSISSAPAQASPAKFGGVFAAKLRKKSVKHEEGTELTDIHVYNTSNTFRS